MAKVGRPRKFATNALACILNPQLQYRAQGATRGRGRPKGSKKKYGKLDLSAEDLAFLLAKTQSKQAAQFWGDRWDRDQPAPKTQKAAMRFVLRMIGVYPDYADSALRAVRRIKRTNNPKNSR